MSSLVTKVNAVRYIAPVSGYPSEERAGSLPGRGAKFEYMNKKAQRAAAYAAAHRAAKKEAAKEFRTAAAVRNDGQYVAPNRTPTPFGQSAECVKPIRNRRNKYQAPRTYRLSVAEQNTCAVAVAEQPYTGAVAHTWAQTPAAKSQRWFLKSVDGYVGGGFNG